MSLALAARLVSGSPMAGALTGDADGGSAGSAEDGPGYPTAGTAVASIVVAGFWGRERRGGLRIEKDSVSSLRRRLASGREQFLKLSDRHAARSARAPQGLGRL
ncbi:hypothetical protein Sa4125_42440 [Aureimonas sp. SA4125]|nr:hypothetical protein Sa4125_42440 [Aureimonas sp. SA4125]